MVIDFQWSWDSLVGIVTRLQAGQSGFNSWQGLGIFLFATMSRLAQGPTHSPVQWVLGFLSVRIKWLECEGDHSPPSSTEVMNLWSYTSTPPISFHGMVLS
jgi:hypothetical protein